MAERALLQEQRKQQEGFKLLLLSEDVRGQRSSKLTRNDRDENYTNTRACQISEAVHEDFTKLLKTAYLHIRHKGFISSTYIDDCYLQGNTFEDYN